MESMATCRLCLEQYSAKNSSFCILNEAFQAALQRVFPFEVHPEPNLPDYACGVCSGKIFNFHSYVGSVEENQRKLREGFLMLANGSESDCTTENDLTTRSDCVRIKESSPPLANDGRLDEVSVGGACVSKLEDDTGEKEMATKVVGFIDDIKVEEYIIQELIPEEIPNIRNCEEESVEPCEAAKDIVPVRSVSEHNDDAGNDAQNVASYTCSWCKRTFAKNSHICISYDYSAKKKLHNYSSRTLVQPNGNMGHKDTPNASDRRECEALWSNVAEEASETGSRSPELRGPMLDSDASMRSRKAAANETSFPCDQCERTFASKKQRNDHRYHHTQTQCPICAKQIKRKYLASHVAAHEGAFCCEICMRTYSTRNHLRRHNAVKHYIRTTFPCALCKCSFPNASALIIHRQKMHRIQKCSGCNKMIGPAKMKDYLAAHEGAHRCGMCGRTFASKKGLKRHTQKAIPCSCPICKQVLSPGKAKKHLNAHKEPVLRCETCGKVRFTAKERLKLHIQKAVHCKDMDGNEGPTGKKGLALEATTTDAHVASFRCETCGKTFSKAQGLKTHTENATPCKCPICKKVLSSKKAKEHMEAHNGAFRCSKCGKTFASKCSWVNHSQRVNACKPQSKDCANNVGAILQ
nr:zinc finger protein 845-like [Anopheles coluzzii]